MTGLVLAGGRSTRMGTDKALLRVDGRRLVDIAVATLGAVCDAVIVAAGRRRIPDLDVPQIDDPAQGPLPAIVAGLRAARSELVAVVAADMPRADAAVLRRLADLWDGESAVAPVVNGVVQPLHAVYATAATERFAALVDAGERSPTRALASLDARLAAPQAWWHDGLADDFAVSVNSPADLRRLVVPAPRGRA